MSMTLEKLETEKPFPGPVPAVEGVQMELWDNFLTVLIQLPGLTRDELRAFKKGFKKYSYLESDTPVPIALWIFKFGKPHGPVECNFNARIVRPEYIKAYLNKTEGIKNAIQFYLLDGKMLRGIKLVGLDVEAVDLFHATIRKQLESDYSQHDFDRYLSGLFEFDADELFSMGKSFNHKKPAV
jgi:hypothetical protein